MKFRFVWVVSFTLGLISVFPALAQPYHQLRLEDFSNSSQTGESFIAYTNCNINFTFQPKQVINGAYYLNFEFKLSVDHNRSWINRSMITSQEQLSEILKHEQGHYNLAFFELQEMQRIFSQQRFTSNYKEEVTALFHRIDARYKQLNLDYDEDTGHMLNRKQQNSWDLWFRRKLGYNTYAYNGKQ